MTKGVLVSNTRTHATVVVPWWALPFAVPVMAVYWLMLGLWRLSVGIVRGSFKAYVWAGRDFMRTLHRLLEPKDPGGHW